MNSMTLRGLLQEGNSYYATYEAEYMVVWVSAYDNPPEAIINPRVNFESKLDYYKEAYTEDLTLKANKNIKIVNYSFIKSEEINGYF